MSEESCLARKSAVGSKLGLCPIGKFVFSHEDAMHYKRGLQASLKQWGMVLFIRDVRQCAAVIEEALRFVPGVEAVRLDRP